MKAAAATLVVAVCFLAACGGGRNQHGVTESTQRPVQDPWLLPQYDEIPLETQRAAEDFGGQLARVCISEIYRNYPAGLPPDLPAAVAVDRCARGRVSAATGDPVGDSICGSKADLEDYLLCQVQGALLTQFRVNAGGPARLTEAEWRNSDLAKDNLISEYVAQAFVSCTRGGQAEIEKCQMETFVSSLGLPKSDVDYCRTRGNFAASCLADKAVARFLRDLARRLWD